MYSDSSLGQFPSLIDPVALSVDQVRAAQRKVLADQAAAYERRSIPEFLGGDPLVIGSADPAVLPDIEVKTFPWWLVAIGVGLVLSLMHGRKGGDW